MSWLKAICLISSVFLFTACAELFSQRQAQQVQASRLAELERRCQEYQVQYYRLLEKFKEEQSNAQKQISTLQNELNSLKESSLKKELELSSKNEELEFHLRNKEKELQLASEKYKATVSALDNQLTELKSLVEKLEKEKNDNATRLNTEIQAKNQLQQQLSQLQQQNNDLKAQLEDLKKELAKKESQLTILNEQIKQAETEKQQLSASNQTLSKELGDLRNELAKTQKRITELETSGTSVQLPAYLTEALPAFQKLLGDYLNKGVAKISAEKHGLVITIQNETLYQPGTVILSNEGKHLLAQLVAEIKKLPLTEIIVEGHTDNLPLKDLPFFDNWALGAARATNVVGYFVEMGVKPKLLKAVSASFYQPVATNDTPEGRSKNRRVEIILK